MEEREKIERERERGREGGRERERERARRGCRGREIYKRWWFKSRGINVLVFAKGQYMAGKSDHRYLNISL